MINADFFFRFFLLRVVRLDLQLACSQLQTDTTVLFVGQDRGTAEGFAQCLAIAQNEFVAALGQNALVIRELAVNQLRGEGEFAGGSTNVVLAQNCLLYTSPSPRDRG